MTERHPIDAAAMNTFGRAPRWGFGLEQVNQHVFLRDDVSRPGRRITDRSAIWSAASILKGCGRMNGVRPRTRTPRWSNGSRPPARSKVIKTPSFVPGVSTHAYGGTRMGDNPDTNVVNRSGFHIHDICIAWQLARSRSDRTGPEDRNRHRADCGKARSFLASSLPCSILRRRIPERRITG
jgi:hypothetical protein